MNCLDCSLGGATVPAVATCHSCGAAVCADHAVIRPHYLQRVVPLDRLVPVEPPARVISCTICAAAQDAASHPEPAHWPLFRRRHARAAEVPSTTPTDAGPAGRSIVNETRSPATASRSS